MLPVDRVVCIDCIMRAIALTTDNGPALETSCSRASVPNDTNGLFTEYTVEDQARRGPTQT